MLRQRFSHTTKLIATHCQIDKLKDYACAKIKRSLFLSLLFSSTLDNCPWSHRLPTYWLKVLKFSLQVLKLKVGGSINHHCLHHHRLSHSALYSKYVWAISSDVFSPLHGMFFWHSAQKTIYHQQVCESVGRRLSESIISINNPKPNHHYHKCRALVEQPNQLSPYCQIHLTFAQVFSSSFSYTVNQSAKQQKHPNRIKHIWTQKREKFANFANIQALIWQWRRNSILCRSKSPPTKWRLL